MKISFIFVCFILCSIIHQGLPTQYFPEENVKNIKVDDQISLVYDYESQLFSAPPKKVAAPLRPLRAKGAIPATDLALIMKHIEAINFKNLFGTFCCGRLTITKPQISTEVIGSNGTSVLVSSNYGQGRAAVLASHLLFQESTLSNDKNWVFLLRNLIKYVANAAYAKYEILAIGLSPSKAFKQLLSRAGLQSNITFAWDLKNFQTLTKTQFQVVLIGSFSLEHLAINDYYKITQFVSNGGGIITTYRPECQGCYLQPTRCEDLSKKCLHNTFLHQMGIKFNDLNVIALQLLQYNITQKMNLTNIVLRKYQKKNMTKISNPVQGFIDDYNAITQGVVNISYPGAAYSSFRYSDESYFPIVDKDRNSVMIAGRYWFGKLFFQGHGTLLQKQGADNLKLLTNIVKWLSGNKTTLKAGFLFNSNYNSLTAFLNISANITKSMVNSVQGIQGMDIIVVTYLSHWPVNLTTAMLTALKAYVQKGGSILFCSHGWVWGSYGQGSTNPNLTYQLNFADYVIAKQFDVYLQSNIKGIQNPYIIYNGSRMVEVDNFLKNDLLRVLYGQQTFLSNDTKIAQYISKIQFAKNISAVCDILTYHNIVDAFVASRFNIQIYYDKIPANNRLINNVFKIMNALSFVVSPSECRALPPSLNKYPGCASKLIVNKTISFYKNITERVYTGLYVNPGEVVRITHNNTFYNVMDLTLEINHGDDLYDSNNGNLKRFPNIVRSFQINNRNFTIASPHGGILYFRVPKYTNLTTQLFFQILGAYEAPYFNQNLHTEAQFSVIRLADAPLFVFQTKKFVHIGPTFGVFGSIIINITRLCSYWNKLIQTYKEYRNISISPFLKDSTYNDVNIAGGYMHSGNPFMTFQDVTIEFLGWKNSIFLKGNWGAYHQLGHNHQEYKWTTSAAIQVTVNIYSLYLMYIMHGIPVLEHPWFMNDYLVLLEKFQNYLLLPFDQKIPIFNADVRFALYFYAILMDELGLTIFSSLHKKYDLLTDNPQTDAAKYELLVYQLSLVANLNMWDYFKNWGIPVTDASKAKIGNLTKYKCRRHPSLTP